IIRVCFLFACLFSSYSTRLLNLCLLRRWDVMAGCKSASRSLLATIVVLVLLVHVGASVYDKKRGLKTYGLSDEQIKEYMKDHDPHHIINKHKNKESLKEHPEVKRFLEWRQMHKDGHPDAGVAFAGKIPHDFVPHMVEHPNMPKKDEL
ncbi:hypothetical protein Agub_g1597, partial [Astrephomene gubernaculifera]